MADVAVKLGDSARQSAKWEEATTHYSRAIELIHGNCTDDLLAELLCKRAECYIERCEYHLARVDVKWAKDLRPSWYLVWAREGAVFEGLQDWHEALHAFEHAYDLSQPASGYSNLLEYVKACEIHDKLVGPVLRAEKLATDDPVRTPEDRDFTAKAEKFSKAEFKKRLASRVALQSQKRVREGLDSFMRDYRPGCSQKAFAGFWQALDYFHYSPEAIQFDTSKHSSDAVKSRLFAAGCEEGAVLLGLDLKSTMDPREEVRTISQHIEKKGWNAFGGERRWVLSWIGFKMGTAMDEIGFDTDKAVKLFRRLAINIEEFLRLRPELKEGELGEALEARLFQCRLALLDEVSRHMVEIQERPSNDVVEELSFLSELCVDSAIAKLTKTIPSGDSLLNYVQRDRPLARALFGQAVSLQMRAKLRENFSRQTARASWLDQTMCRTAAALAQKAADLCAEDDDRKSLYLDFALRSEILAGGLTVREIFSRVAAVARSRRYAEAFFGPAEGYPLSSQDFATILLRRIETAELKNLADPRHRDRILDTRIKQPPVLALWSNPVLPSTELDAIEKLAEAGEGYLVCISDEPATM